MLERVARGIGLAPRPTCFVLRSVASKLPVASRSGGFEDLLLTATVGRADLQRFSYLLRSVAAMKASQNNRGSMAAIEPFAAYL